MLIRLKNAFWNRCFRRVQSNARAFSTARPRVPVCVEWLEDRTLLTGNVSGMLVGGTLILTGDAANNSIDVTVDGSNVVVQGQDGTTVNGQTGAVVAFQNTTSVQHSLHAYLGDGDDQINITGVDVGLNLIVYGGAGNDTLNVADMNVGLYALLFGQEGADRFDVSNVQVDRGMQLFGSTGDDLFTLQDSQIGRHRTDDLLVFGGMGNDAVAIGNTQVSHNLLFVDSTGDDTLLFNNVDTGNDQHLVTGIGNDSIRITSSTIHDDLRIYACSGDDGIVLENVDIQDDATLITGIGNDTISTTKSNVRDDVVVVTSTGEDAVVFKESTIGDDMVLDSGPGNDTVSITDTAIQDDMVIATSVGDNFVYVDPSQVGDDTVIVGGPGNDSIVFQGANSFADHTILVGGSGTDAAKIDDANTFGRTPRRIGIDGNDVSDDVIDSGLNDPNTGALARADALSQRLNSLSPPTAIDDQYQTNTGVLTVDAATGVLSNDTTSELNGSLTAAIATDPAHGTATLNADGSFEYESDTNFNGTDTFTYQLTDAFGSTATATVTIEVDIADPLTLELDVSNNSTVESNDTLLTYTQNFQIDGTTAPDATIDVDVDGDGEFNDGSAVADGNGVFTVEVALLHDQVNLGANHVEVRARDQFTQELTKAVDVHFAVGTVARFESSMGTFDVELLDTDAPQTVAAFLSDAHRYDNSIIHRSIDNFMIQGGGFTVVDNAGGVTLGDVPRFDAVPNEFKPENSNVRGTLSTAQISSDINSFTSQWFINTVDNLHLDTVPHTVFGRVVGTGMTIVDAINDTVTYNLNGVFPESALATVPLQNYTPFTKDITGTVTVAPDGAVVNGTGTAFTTELQAGSPGSDIQIAGETFFVQTINNDAQMVLDATHSTGATDATAQVNDIPAEESFIIFSKIAELDIP